MTVTQLMYVNVLESVYLILWPDAHHTYHTYHTTIICTSCCLLIIQPFWTIGFDRFDTGQMKIYRILPPLPLESKIQFTGYGLLSRSKWVTYRKTKEGIIMVSVYRLIGIWILTILKLFYIFIVPSRVCPNSAPTCLLSGPPTLYPLSPVHCLTIHQV